MKELNSTVQDYISIKVLEKLVGLCVTRNTWAKCLTIHQWRGKGDHQTWISHYFYLSLYLYFSEPVSEKTVAVTNCVHSYNLYISLIAASFLSQTNKSYCRQYRRTCQFLHIGDCDLPVRSRLVNHGCFPQGDKSQSSCLSTVFIRF